MCRIHRRQDRPLASGPGTGVYCEPPTAPGAKPTDGDLAVDEAAQANPSVLSHLIPMIRLCARPVMFSPCPACQQPGVPLVPLMLSLLRIENRSLYFSIRRQSSRPWLYHNRTFLTYWRWGAFGSCFSRYIRSMYGVYRYHPAQKHLPDVPVPTGIVFYHAARGNKKAVRTRILCRWLKVFCRNEKAAALFSGQRPFTCIIFTDYIAYQQHRNHFLSAFFGTNAAYHRFTTTLFLLCCKPGRERSAIFVL